MKPSERIENHYFEARGRNADDVVFYISAIEVILDELDERIEKLEQIQDASIGIKGAGYNRD